MPGAARLKQLHSEWKTPAAAIVATSALTVVTCLWADGFAVVTSISTITLYLAYVLPIFLNARNRLRRRGEFVTAEMAPWNLGRWAPIINYIAIAWVALITLVFSVPPNELVLWTVLSLGAALAVYWFVWARARFVGPTPADEAALRVQEFGGEANVA